MQIFHERPREFRHVERIADTQTIIDPAAAFLPLDDCEQDDY